MVTFLRSAAIEGVAAALRTLACPETFRKRYGAWEDQQVILYPVGIPLGYHG